MSFDPEKFMNSTVDQPFETERTLCPPGEYKMAIDDFTSEAFDSFEFEYRKGERAGEKGVIHKFNVPIVVLDDKVAAHLEMDKVVVYKTINLDLDEDGDLVWGKNKNIALGQLRNAVGQNAKGPWSPSQLRGSKPFVGRVEHRRGKRKDGSEFVIAEVTTVAPIR